MNGIDVSHHQGQIEWAQVCDSGIAFAFIKATEGLSYTDPLFAKNWAAARHVGIRRGAYHFFRPQLDPVRQAQHFLAVIGHDHSELPPVLDVEVLDGVAPQEVITRTQQCMGVLTEELTVAPILYTSAYFWRDTLGNPPAFSNHPLWIAHYTHALSPTVPRAWATWTFWQHSQEGRVHGIAGNVDLNRCNEKVMNLS